MISKYLFRKRVTKASSTRATAASMASSTLPAAFCAIILEDVRAWRVPHEDLHQQAYWEYLVAITAPIDALDADLLEKRLDGEQAVRRLVELAPDLMHKAIGASPLDVRHFLEGAGS